MKRLMPIALNERHLIAAAIVCLMGSTAIHAAGSRWSHPRDAQSRALRGPALLQAGSGEVGAWRAASPTRGVEKAAVVLALLCLVVRLGLPATQRGGWPLIMPAEVIIAAAAGAILWRLVNKPRYEPQWTAPVLYAIVSSMLMWGLARGSSPQTASIVDSWQQTWLFGSHLALALACGAFVLASSLALASLLTEKQQARRAVGPPQGWPKVLASGEKAGHHAMLPGLPLLTASLVIAALGEQYTRGVRWDWTVSESWQLLAWLFYTVIWCATVLLGWRGRRSWSLTAAGLIVTLLMLNAVGGSW